MSINTAMIMHHSDENDGNSEVDDLINLALADGRLVPCLENWVRELGQKDIAVLSGFLSAFPTVNSKIGA